MTGKMTAAVLYGKEDVKIEKVPIPHLEDGEVYYARWKDGAEWDDGILARCDVAEWAQVERAAAVVGGAKVSTKLELLGNLSAIANTIVIGGGMANTFLAAKGVDVGKSLCEHDLTGTAEEMLRAGRQAKVPVMVGATSADIGWLPADSKEALFAHFGAQASAVAGADAASARPIPSRSAKRRRR